MYRSSPILCAVAGLMLGYAKPSDLTSADFMLIVAPPLYIIGAVRETHAAKHGITPRKVKVKVDDKSAPGRELLNVCGIIMIAFGALMATIMLGNGLANVLTDLTDKRTAFYFCGMGAVGILQLTAGIVGVRNRGKPKKATTCLAWGIVAEASAVAGIVLDFTVEVNRSAIVENRNLYALVLVPPVLFIIGTALNRKAARTWGSTKK